VTSRRAKEQVASMNVRQVAAIERPEANLSKIEREAAAEEERERKRARLERNRRELRAAKPKVVPL
jgi:hypothetical protein